MNETTQEHESTAQEIVPVVKQEELQAIKKRRHTIELRKELAVQINQQHADYLKLTVGGKAIALAIENARITLGNTLSAAKKEVKPGNYLKWLADNCKEISPRVSQYYISYAKKHKGKLLENVEQLREYKKLFTLWGTVPTNAGTGHGQQTLHFWNPFTEATKVIAKVTETFTQIWDKKPKDEWTDNELEQLKEQLEPLVKIYETL